MKYFHLRNKEEHYVDCGRRESGSTLIISYHSEVFAN
jgi:hypothetical protein